MPERNLPFFEMFAKYHPAPALAAQLETWLVTGAVMDSHSRTIEVKLLCTNLPAPALLDQVGREVSQISTACRGDLPPRLPPGSGRVEEPMPPPPGRGCPAAPRGCRCPPWGRLCRRQEAPAPAAGPAPAPEEPAGGAARKRISPSRKNSSARPSHAAAGHEGRHGRPQKGPGLFLPADLAPADQKGPQAHEHPGAGHGVVTVEGTCSRWSTGS